MIDRVRLAARNVRRNGRRTFISLMMISGGIAAITVFEGLTHNLLIKMRDVVINTQLSHVQIANEKAWNAMAVERAGDRLLSLDEATVARIRSSNQVEYVSGRLSFFGILTRGEQSTSARGIGFNPAAEVRLRESLHVIRGHSLALQPNPGCEMLMGLILAEQIGAKPGETVTMLGYTTEGAMNAFDCEVSGIFQNGAIETDNVFYVSLHTAQKFLGTQNVDRVIVQLKDTEQTDDVLLWLKTILPREAAPKSWQELSMFFRQTVEYIALQTSVIRWIILLLALLATLNTIGLSISERAGEIGTVRALGDSRTRVLGQFLIESVILALAGAISGSVLGVCISELLTSLHIPFVIPGASVTLPLEVDLLPKVFRDAVLSMCAVTVVATLWPALRASQLEIVEALKRSI